MFLMYRGGSGGIFVLYTQDTYRIYSCYISIAFTTSDIEQQKHKFDIEQF